MKLNTPDSHSLKGALILADPTLRDENFSRTVVLMTEHQPGLGAHGYIFNRPLERKVGEVLVSEEFSSLREVPIFLGGPVGREHLTFAAFAWVEDQTGLHCSTHLSVEQAIERHAAGQLVRAFLGYAGWGEGQLEQELEGKSWIARPPSAELLLRAPDEALWEHLLRSMGPWGKLVAGLPENPSLN